MCVLLDERLGLATGARCGAHLPCKSVTESRTSCFAHSHVGGKSHQVATLSAVAPVRRNNQP
jgi:hypothetical protein